MSSLSVEGIAITSDLTGVSSELPRTEGVIRTKFLFDATTTLLDGKIQVREQSIDGRLNPDVASIVTITSTPVQRNDGDSQITEMLLRTSFDAPIGILLISPDGQVYDDIYDPLTQKGLPGFIVEKGWIMQMIVPYGAELEFLEYWSPRGFCDTAQGEKLYGETVLTEVPESSLPDQFIILRAALSLTIKVLADSRINSARKCKLRNSKFVCTCLPIYLSTDRQAGRDAYRPYLSLLIVIVS